MSTLLTPESVKLLVYGYIRQLIESDKSWVHTIPLAIKAICNKYHGFVFTESNILDHAQQWKLWKLLSQKIIFGRTSLLYNALRDGFTEDAFYRNIEGKKQTLLIAHTNYGNIYGVYTTVNWKKGHRISNDKNAFVWLLKSDKGDHIKPQIFCPKNGSIRVYQSGQLPNRSIICFFECPAIFSFKPNCNVKHDNVAWNNSNFDIEDASILCGGDTKSHWSNNERIGYNFGCIDTEIFQIYS